MALIERTAYPRFRQNLSTSELRQLYTPTLQELNLARRTTRGGEGQQTRLPGNAQELPAPRLLPTSRRCTPEAVVSHLCSRLRLTDARMVPPSRSRQRYRDAIREYFGVKPFGDDARRVAAEALAEATLTMDDPADLVNVAIEELVKERYELPAFSTLDRLTRHVKHAVNARLFARVDERITPGNKRSLEDLLETGSRGRSALNAIKVAPQECYQEEPLRDAGAIGLARVIRRHEAAFGRSN